MVRHSNDVVFRSHGACGRTVAIIYNGITGQIILVIKHGIAIFTDRDRNWLRRLIAIIFLCFRSLAAVLFSPKIVRLIELVFACTDILTVVADFIVTVIRCLPLRIQDHGLTILCDLIACNAWFIACARTVFPSGQNVAVSSALIDRRRRNRSFAIGQCNRIDRYSSAIAIKQYASLRFINIPYPDTSHVCIIVVKQLRWRIWSGNSRYFNPLAC